jgi:hypothetical protein
MKIDDIHGFIKFLTKKARTGYFSPEEIDDAVNWASLDLFNELYGLRYLNQPQRAVPLTAYEINQKNKDDLRVFIENKYAMALTNGIGDLPADYIHWSMMQTTNDNKTKEVKVIDDAKWSSRINRVTAAPSKSSPVCRIYNSKVEFSPTDLLNITLTYLKKPTTAKWAYTVVDGRPVWDQGNSVDFEWGEENSMEIISRALTFLGVNLEDVNLQQYTRYRKEAGK